MEKCIYVVEDNAGIRDVIEFLLTEEKYLVKTCPTVTNFWQQMKKHTPDMIVLDIMLPDGNGIEICDQLKKNVKTYNIPIMMMSANNYLNDVKTKCAAEDFINKPFDINDFLDRIDRQLQN